MLAAKPVFVKGQGIVQYMYCTYQATITPDQCETETYMYIMWDWQTQYSKPDSQTTGSLLRITQESNQIEQTHMETD